MIKTKIAKFITLTIFLFLGMSTVYVFNINQAVAFGGEDDKTLN